MQKNEIEKEEKDTKKIDDGNNDKLFLSIYKYIYIVSNK